MKRTFPFMIAAILMISAVFIACKKDDDKKEEETKPPVYTCASCTTAPEALAVNDNSSKGIYKGVVIGSSGTVKFDVANNGSTISAVLVIDGTTVNLSSSVQWTAGQPYVAPFTGTLNGQPVSITFSVSLNGGSVEITSSSIPGHANASFTLVKETSTALIEAFEGTYSTTKPESGTFNIILSRTIKRWGGAARKDGTTESNDVDGTISDNGDLVDGSSGKVTATLSGDNLNGSFVDSGGRTVTVTGKRTM